jgi:seryl-tRNA synthetase
MHDIKFIRDTPELFDLGLKRRGLEPLSATLLQQDTERRALIQAIEAKLARRNAASKEIGAAKAQKDEAKAASLMAEVAALKVELPGLEADEQALGAALEGALATIPNLPASDVPDGVDETGNFEVKRIGSPREFNYQPLQHFDLGEALGMMDFETAAKISGARFVVLKGQLARLERALGAFMLDIHTQEHGYTETNPPLLVRPEAAFGTGNLPKFEDDLFSAVGANSFLQEALKGSAVRNHFFKVFETYNFADPSRYNKQYSEEALRYGQTALDALPSLTRLLMTPTAEVSVTNYVRDQILNEDQLPLRYTAQTPCFRSEAGSAGRDTRGMIRLHQFMKVEMVSITTPEASDTEHERMTRAAETILERLALPYRRMLLCSGDMGFSSRKTYDLEVWLPGQGAYREISSCSNCGDFQARRMGARLRNADGKGTRFVHTLNGSGVAVGRCLVAVLENYQNADGTITVPAALRPYMGGLETIGKA